MHKLNSVSENILFWTIISCFICVSVAYIQTTRALMVTGSILGLPAVGMVLMSMPCISLGNEPQSSKNKRTMVGGVLILIVGKRLNFYSFTHCHYNELGDKD